MLAYQEKYRKIVFGSTLQWKSYITQTIRFLWFVGALWLIELLDEVYFHGYLQQHGTQPGNWSHWEGIFFAPFLHMDWSHLTSNTTALLVLGPMILIHGWNHLLTASFFSALGAGLIIMIIGETNSNHIGASGLVYGYAFFLVGLGIYKRTPLTIITALIVLSLYGYMNFFYGLIPQGEQIIGMRFSWEGHLGGAIGGFLAARINIGRGL